ncbi:MAG: hypothetical protein ACI9RM_002739, partial [Ulvibacter sp.]
VGDLRWYIIHTDMITPQNDQSSRSFFILKLIFLIFLAAE